jgi:hypothetical protein
MSEKHGLCIGGPLDGERRSAEGEILKAQILRELSPVFYDAAPKWDEIITDVFVYRHFSIGVADGDEMSKLGFWVEAGDKRPFHTVMISLLNGYAENAKRSKP